MKVNQIATILNSVYNEIIGESALVNEDLSNIVDVGRHITSSTQWGKNFDNYVGKLIDKVGRTVFVDRAYTAQDLGIWKDSWTYGSILEKVRCDVGDYKENKEWNLVTDSAQTYDVFAFNAPTVIAKYFNSKTTFSLKLSITRKQAESAFNSAQDMGRFIAMIENRVRMKMELAKEALSYRTIVNLIAEKINSGNNVINLLKDYKTLHTNSTLTAATALTDKEFLRYAAKEIMIYKQLISKASTLYNNDGYTTFTPPERLRAIFLTDFAKSLETTLYADTFNEEFVKLDGYKEIPYWQGSGTTGAYTDRSKIEARPASLGATPSVDDGKNIAQGGIVAVLFDEEAAMCCNEDPEVSSIYNPEGRFYNYWYTFDCSYFNDLAENVIVFEVADTK